MRTCKLILTVFACLVVAAPGALAAERNARAQRARPRERMQAFTRAPEGVRVYRDLEYTRPGGRAVHLDLYLPRVSEGRLPVVVWIHGGGFRAGSKDRCRAVWLTGRGYAVASINYRLSGEAIFPAHIEDCKAAIRWLRAEAAWYNLDPSRIGVWGSSAGGHLSALLGTSGDVKELEGQGGNLTFPSRVQAVCDWYGPSDFLHMDVSGRRARRPGVESPESMFLGGPIEEKKEKAALASPVTHVTRDDPPFLIMHGDQDPTVPYPQSRILEAALKKAGVEVTLHTLKGAGHGGPQFSTPEVTEMIAAFFDRHLKGAGGKSKTAP